MIAVTRIVDMEIHDRLEELREHKGWSRREVARRLERKSSTVDTWFTGVSEPSLSEAVALADVFGVTLEELAGRQPRQAELSEDERYVLNLYRDLGLTRTQAAMSLAVAARTSAEPSIAKAPLSPPIIPEQQQQKKRPG